MPVISKQSAEDILSQIKLDSADQWTPARLVKELDKYIVS
jgi:hypothetical protein